MGRNSKRTITVKLWRNKVVAWLARNEVSIVQLAEEAGVNRPGLQNTIKHRLETRPSTMDAVDAAMERFEVRWERARRRRKMQ